MLAGFGPLAPPSPSSRPPLRRRSLRGLGPRGGGSPLPPPRAFFDLFGPPLRTPRRRSCGLWAACRPPSPRVPCLVGGESWLKARLGPLGVSPGPCISRHRQQGRWHSHEKSVVPSTRQCVPEGLCQTSRGWLIRTSRPVEISQAGSPCRRDVMSPVGEQIQPRQHWGYGSVTDRPLPRTWGPPEEKCCNA